MTTVGYTNRWSVHAGEELPFYISSDQDYSVSIVRLIHGDENPLGPGFKCIEVEKLPETFPEKHQPIRTGSYVRLKLDKDFPSSPITISLWVMPTSPGPSDQGIFCSADGGIALFLDVNAKIILKLGSHRLKSKPISVGRWTFVQASFDTVTGKSALHIQAADYDPRKPSIERLSGRAAECKILDCILVGAMREARPYHPEGCFNGRIGKVRVDNAWLADIPLAYTRGGSETTVLEWHFGLEAGSRKAIDLSRHQRHGEVINRPTRAVTGVAFSGQYSCFTEAPDEYDAIHFHADDLEDCRWDESFKYKIPSDFKSGIYAAAIISGRQTRYIPFAVTPKPGEGNASIAVLLPTLSYMAYSNECLDITHATNLYPHRAAHLQKEDYEYISANGINSLYDRHIDGTGRCIMTILRPNLTSWNPLHRARVINAPHQLSSDLYLIDWLEEKGIDFDIITDHELHNYGVKCLSPYITVLTGTHAEYWSGAMLTGLHDYQEDGGRVIYLSGNGLYWATALDSSGTICEIRRFGGTEAWSAGAGEVHISLTGEQGGLWKNRGRTPQSMVGVGMAAQGFDRGAAYRRTAASNDPRAAFIFEGIQDEALGDFPNLVLNHGAAGFEIDRLDYKMGTPGHALLLASATEFSDSYQYVREDLMMTVPYLGGSHCPNVRSDMVFYETPNGGAVFSVGSISFCSALSYNNYNNNISKILDNVLVAFSNPAWRPKSLRN